MKMTNFFKELGKAHAKEFESTEEKSSPLSFQLEQEDFKKLEFYCEKLDINKTKFINMIIKEKLIFALAEYLDSSGKNLADLDTSNLNLHQKAYLNGKLSLASLELKESKEH
jgi:hypothetical protein